MHGISVTMNMKHKQLTLGTIWLTSFCFRISNFLAFFIHTPAVSCRTMTLNLLILTIGPALWINTVWYRTSYSFKFTLREISTFYC